MTAGSGANLRAGHCFDMDTRMTACDGHGRPQSGLTAAAFTTFVHFTMSSRIT